MKKVKFILNTLMKNNYEAFIVGGAVRDILLKKTPHDIDITTNATPTQIMQLFPNVVPTGIKFGTVTVMLDGEGFEITTFRADGKYLDGRRPEVVTFGKTINEDLFRRDFTINAMAMDIDGRIIDPFGGREDLNSGIIKAVGSPEKRFSEDALRILRAFRFSAKYGFKVAPATLSAIKNKKEGLKLISAERIREELTKIFLTHNVAGTFCLMQKIGILDIILSEITEINIDILRAIEYARKVSELRWALLLSHNNKEAEKILIRLKFSNKEKAKIMELILFNNKDIVPVPKEIRKIKSQLNFSTVEELLDIRKAIAMVHPISYVELRNIENAKKISIEEPKLSIKNLAVNGYDIMTLKLRGKEIGTMLKYLLELVIENPEYNNKKDLLEFAKRASFF